jgi:4'-phosphopantetheinyl transferase
MQTGAIHVFCGLLGDVDTVPTRAACMGMLSPAEKQRAGRFISERHAGEFLIAHGLLRAALSVVVPAIHPPAWRFVTDRYGRPFVAGRGDALYFSLSHTDGCVACAISDCEEVGIDVEATDRFASPLSLAEHFFSAAEVAALRALPAVEQPGRFFEYWTLKEAYIKARGMGLSLQLDRFSMLIGPAEKIAISFEPDFGDEASRWHFVQMSPSRRHRLAVADGSGMPGGLPVLVRPWPLP